MITTRGVCRWRRGPAVAALVLAALLVALPAAPAAADIWGKTRARNTTSLDACQLWLSSRVEGQWTNVVWDTFVDAARLARSAFTIYSLFQGVNPDLLLSLGFSPGSAWSIAEAMHNYDFVTSPRTAFNAFQQLGDLLRVSADKTAAAGQLCTVEGRPGRQSGTRVTLEFEVGSDDDPFGHLRALVPPVDGVTVDEPLGLWSKDGRVTVNLDLARLAPGLYPIEFFAKETDCGSCLSIVHSVMVQVTPGRPPEPPPPPCPPLGQACLVKVDAFRRVNAPTAASEELDRLSAVIRESDRRAIRAIEAKEHVCKALGRQARGNFPPPPGQLLALPQDNPYWADLNQCLNELFVLIREVEGPCPEVAMSATAAQCAAVEALQAQLLEEERRIAPVRSALVADIKCLNCCVAGVNPRGGRGPAVATSACNTADPAAGARIGADPGVAPPPLRVDPAARATPPPARGADAGPPPPPTPPMVAMGRAGGAPASLAGRWQSNVGLIYVIAQTGTSFTWTVEGQSQQGRGTISGDTLAASWTDGPATGSAKGAIKQRDAAGRPTRIEWDNGVVFTRAR